MSPLTLRKRLLVAESELNRVHLVEDATVIKAGVVEFTDRSRSFTTIASSVIALVTGLLALRPGRPAAESKPSWLASLLNSSGVIAALWQAFKPPDPRN